MMPGRGRAGLILVAGLVLLAAGGLLHLVLLERHAATIALLLAGGALSSWGLAALWPELARQGGGRRGEIALTTLSLVAILVALAYLAARQPVRFDMTSAGRHSLSPSVVTMLRRLKQPVHISFFHDPLMRPTVELYELFAAESGMITVEFHDPTLDPAQARLSGVRFAGTAVLSSGGRTRQSHGDTETDIANAILRVSQGEGQRICFLSGHGEADPFSMESHDHIEGTGGHSHGMGAKYVLHERHGLAKARNALEALGFETAGLALTQTGDAIEACALLVVAGPRIALLAAEIDAIRRYLANGGNAFFMIDPHVDTGLAPLLAEFGIRLDDTIVIDEASHFWSDPSAPAVTSYYRHRITRELPLTFFPGARSLSPTEKRVAGASVAPLVNASRVSFGERSGERAAFDSEEDLKGPMTLMVLATKRSGVTRQAAEALLRGGKTPTTGEAADDFAKGSKIAVVGDSDFATNSFFHVLGNGNLFLNTVSHLTAKADLIGIEPRTHDLPRLNVTNRQMKATFVATVLLVPALLLLTGFAVWWRRR